MRQFFLVRYCDNGRENHGMLIDGETGEPLFPTIEVHELTIPTGHYVVEVEGGKRFVAASNFRYPAVPVLFSAGDEPGGFGIFIYGDCPVGSGERFLLVVTDLKVLPSSISWPGK